MGKGLRLHQWTVGPYLLHNTHLDFRPLTSTYYQHISEFKTEGEMLIENYVT